MAGTNGGAELLRTGSAVSVAHFNESTGRRNGQRERVTFPKYDLEDLDPTFDRHGLQDAWARYMRSRLSDRPAFFQKLNATEKELLRKEIRRIRWFREYFRDYRIAQTDQLPLVALLEDARKKWREQAFKASADQLAALKDDIEKHGSNPLRARNWQILSMVELWDKKLEYGARLAAVSPDHYMGDLDNSDADAGSTEDDPKKPDFGQNGWLIVWEQDEGGVNYQHPLVHGKFPHQKISIQQLLYNKEHTPLKRTSNKKQLRYFHLPANSMKWVEDAMSRYYGEEGITFENGQMVVNTKSQAQRLLRTEMWRGQQRGGPSLQPHARQMGSRCSVVPSARWETREETKNGSVTGKDIAIFMPFLHWEVEKRLHRMDRFTQVATRRKEVSERLKRASTLRPGPRMADVARLQQSRPLRPQTWYDNQEHRRAKYWRPKNYLANYLWHAAKLFQLIDEAADARLIEDHLYSQSPLHMRRTLEQYYYWTATDTTERDHEQVVSKGTRIYNEDPDAAVRLIMVDQLWLWVLDENTIISCFPRRWGRNNPDPSAVHRGIRDRFAALGSDSIGSAYDLAGIVIDECSKVFFDRTKPQDQRPDVVDIFSSAISDTAERKTFAYEAFGKEIARIAADHDHSPELNVRKSLNIGVEWGILVEAQNVIEELQVMQDIFYQQITVLRDCHKSLKALHWSTAPRVQYFGRDEDVDHDAEQADEMQKAAMERMLALIADMEQRKDELASMERLQNKTRQQLRELLDMKQQQSNIIEAQAAIRRADESVLQGRSIVVFTVVTIFFLPLSFFASIFGMNAEEFSSDGNMPLKQQLTYMFAISAAVIFVSLSLAFSTWTRTVLIVPLSLAWLNFTDWTGWRHKTSAYNSTRFKTLHRERVKQLDTRYLGRRLTEISSHLHHRHHHHHRDPTIEEEEDHELQLQQQRSSTWSLSRLSSSNGGGPNLFRSKRIEEDGENV